VEVAFEVHIGVVADVEDDLDDPAPVSSNLGWSSPTMWVPEGRGGARGSLPGRTPAG
jgi:hypothetical protein